MVNFTIALGPAEDRRPTLSRIDADDPIRLDEDVPQAGPRLDDVPDECLLHQFGEGPVVGEEDPVGQEDRIEGAEPPRLPRWAPSKSTSVIASPMNSKRTNRLPRNSQACPR